MTRCGRTCSASCRSARTPPHSRRATPTPIASKDPVMVDSAAAPDLILHGGVITTLDRAHPAATAVAIKDGRFLKVGAARDIMALAGTKTKVIDLKGRRVLPGLCDSHTHIIRGGLNFN